MDPTRNGDVVNGNSRESEKGTGKLGKAPGITIRTVVMAMLMIEEEFDDDFSTISPATGATSSYGVVLEDPTLR